MKDARAEKTLSPNTPGTEKLVFCEKNSGTPRFQVEMSGDREAAFSRAASLLALGCMARGDSPADYAIWVPAENDLIDRIKKHADELLHMGRTFSSQVDLSPREGEVLRELMNHKLNKEIADRLRISVRTVKFHVSSLLAKFGVGSRWDLIQKAQPMLSTKQITEGFATIESPNSSEQTSTPVPPSSEPPSQDRKLRRAERRDDRVVPFRGHLRPA